MTGPGDADAVFVEAPARLHFGVLDLRGDLGRRFGGLGAAIPTPSLLVEVGRAAEFAAAGPDARRAASFARRVTARWGLQGAARIRVHRAIPAHAGLGSGTQLGLAVARALAELHGIDAAAPELARAAGRGRRSAIGTHAFASGGFIVEGGRPPESDAIAPLLARYPLPASWRYVLAIPEGPPGLSGDAEAAAFRRLPPPAAREVERVAHLALMGLLPALVDGDLAAFGAALSEIQRITGGWFAASQGGVFAPGPTGMLIERFAGAGAPGVGQSSWGPTAYAIVRGDAEAERLARCAREWLGTTGQVSTGAFAAEGARVWRAVTKALRD
ncbi:MAG TPA: beta-ribofuranosylaminobenzene 5'-phosphate synthase family protein [Gemmatimonadales bacterium]|nr:beta-ribofuranosylaminobenzene 5'-phosphate synthase family protein [Gemmatimonadales bacterium]